ncbi:diguanylate cyclase [Vibrio sp. 99-70-13A1]|uniref:sensor domain-containing diguanylate cyclase n=1 Tax=Vibrio sp. 99-70-13A1 TaxID=2607601 RepID=UPI001493AFD5|nr:diguanylate cyclase [Vibrio sp. 99-70-13A1]NOH96346.1 diguanylate cyclase [Vibrio sp. 99-70-13A1]
MNNTLYSHILGIITRSQNLPGIEGLQEIKTKIQQACEQYDQDIPKVISILLKAYTADRQSQLDEAMSGYIECLDALHKDDVQLKVFVNGLLASLYVDIEDLHSAYKHYEIVLKDLHKVDDNISALIYCNMSDMYLSLEKFDKAIEFAEKGVTTALNANRQLGCAVSLLNLGYSYAHIGQSQKAIEAINEAKVIADKLDDKRTLALSLGYMAQAMCLDEQYDKRIILNHFELAEHNYQQIKDSHNRLENLLLWAKFLEKNNDMDKAKRINEFVSENFDLKANYSFYSIHAKTLSKLKQSEKELEDVVAIQSAHINYAEQILKGYTQRQTELMVTNVDQIQINQQKDILEQMQKYMGAITEIGQFMATAPDLYAVLPEILVKINTILPTFEFGIALYDKQTDILDYRYFVDTSGLVENLTVACQDHQTVGTYVIQNKATVHLNTVTDDSLAPYVDQSTRTEEDFVVLNDSPVTNSILLTPILLKEEVIGLLSVQHHLSSQYQQHHRYLIEHLASFIAVSLENQKQRKKLEDANRTLEKLSQTDPLTGLYNRYQLGKLAGKLVHSSTQERKMLAVLMIDIDEYKKYNDTHGHLQGDEALTSLSFLMNEIFCDENDYLFRYGGDEFMVICSGQNSYSIKNKVEVLRQAFYDMNLSNPNSVLSDRLSLSIGGANVLFEKESCARRSKTESFKMVCDQADKQLYKVKVSGRDGVLLVESTV